MSVHAANEASYDNKGRWRTRTYAKAEVVGATDEVLYLVGDEFTDGSKRILYIPGDDSPQFQERVSGEWVISPATFSSRAFVIDLGPLGGTWTFERLTSEFVRVGTVQQ